MALVRQSGLNPNMELPEDRRDLAATKIKPVVLSRVDFNVPSRNCGVSA
jgi:hypothetical protein